MKAHWQYFLYVIRHKYFVFLHCITLGVPVWRALVHDWTKFTPAEWGPYVHSFYNPDGSKRNTKTDSGTLDSSRLAYDFAFAWLHHQKTNAHHWQFWLLVNDEDGTAALEMPETYVREMLADWAGAGQAITGKVDPAGWYRRNGEKMIFHPATRVLVEELLSRYF